MPEKVTISHRGARYEIGRGKRYYGIWVIGAPESDPVDRWPETRDGWTQAWMRFVAIETPDTIVAVSQPGAGLRLPRLKRSRPAGATVTAADAGRRGGAGRALAGAGLLGLGVLLGLIGLFPGYVGSPSLASQADQLVPHLLYLAAWAASAALIVAGLPARSGMTRTGAVAGIGLSAVTFGLFFTDLGQVISGGAGLLGAGLVLTLLGWAACAAGSALAFTARPDGNGPQAGGRPVRPRAHHAGPVALLLLAAVGTVATFVPSWDSYTLAQPSTGAAQTVTAGNAFAYPGPMIAGSVLVIAAVIAVAVLAALWHPARQGAAVLAGAVVALAGQAISALIQVSEPVSPSLFGISPARAAAEGLTISAGLTPVFWVYCVFVISLLISGAWLFAKPEYPAMPAPPASPDPASARAAQSTPGQTADSEDGAEDDEESTYA